MKKLILLLLFFQSFSYSQEISLDNLLNIQSESELNLFVFENSFLKRKGYGGDGFFYNPIYKYNETVDRYFEEDYQMRILNMDYREEFGFILSFGTEKYIAENTTFRQKIVKSIKSKCEVERIYYYTKEDDKIMSIEYGSGIIAEIEYNCKNDFDNEVIVGVMENRFVFTPKDVSKR